MSSTNNKHMPMRGQPPMIPMMRSGVPGCHPMGHYDRSRGQCVMNNNKQYASGYYQNQSRQ